MIRGLVQQVHKASFYYSLYAAMIAVFWKEDDSLRHATGAWSRRVGRHPRRRGPAAGRAVRRP